MSAGTVPEVAGPDPLGRLGATVAGAATGPDGLPSAPAAGEAMGPMDAADPASLVVEAAKALAGVCGGFFDPAVLAQLDAALALELAAQARDRAVEAGELLDAGVREGRAAAFLERLACRAAACRAAATRAGKLAGEAASVVAAFGGSVGAGGYDPDVVNRVSGAVLVDVITGLEEAKNSLTAVQMQAEVLFTAQQRLVQARTGVPKAKLGRDVGVQVGLARHESAHRGRQLAELAAVVVRELPHTMDAVTAGIIGEDRARIVASETVFLSAEHRADVDALICADQEKLAGMGSRQIATAARAEAYRLEPEVFVQRREKAVADRYVSLRPAADGMTLLSALIPLKHGVTVINALTQVADAAKAAGDGRGRGQLMADALIHRLTRHVPCDEGQGGVGDHRGPTPENAGSRHGSVLEPGALGPGVLGGVAAPPHTPGLCTTVTEPDIMIELVKTDRSLFDGASDPAIITGHGPIPAPEASTMVLGTASGKSGFSPKLWLRRLFTHPESGALLSMDSRARFFPEGMKEFLRLQYQRCASPYCDAPIRNYDHIKSCAACNQAKEAPGWTVAPTIGPPAGEGPLPGKAPPGSAPPGTTTTTPTGHSYTAVAPALPGTSRRKRRRRRRRRS
ncbi:DUF222 domain-containing protein [Arthrobacter sp. STN4]|uniref:DUF222 domain-containing protein n=1 Tax=Arthrobacter sp. STN4 TaxID=2923276 RepID=UPI00211A0A8C|nr:DUF222 domain-containing protein [Arthrobacter sp. STN4]MCQ9163320.1 13E12 repeat family protein [Arthrobacter sp. STN4]